MKQKLKKAIKTIVFAACFFVLLYAVCCVFSFKYDDGIATIDNFYDLPQDTVDVLLLGSSHMGINVDPSILWELKGIAAYNCWGMMQQPWNTYYYLKECLKYQTPKLVVMDVYGVTFSGDFPGYDNMIKNTQGLRLSGDKVEDIWVSAPEEYRTALLLGLPAYHYRYSEISEVDFQNFFWDRNTGIQTIDTSGFSTQAFDIVDVSKVKEALPLAEKCEKYFTQVLNLCKERDIPILLVAAPYYLHEEEQGKFLRIGEIAESYGVPFLNFNLNYAEIGIDPHKDYCDLAHMNQDGRDKFDAYLANYISAHYELPDRRLDPGHIWNREVETETHCIYALPAKFYGGGHNFVDTGVPLYEKPYASWTLLTEIDTECASEDQVWFSCFSEGDDLRGLLLRREDGNLYIIFSSGKKIEIPDYGKKLKLAIVKDGLKYKVFVDGKEYRTMEISPFEPLEYSLLLGCQVQPDGTRFRYSQTEVDHLEIYDIALTDTEVTQWAPAELPEPPERQAQPADSKAAFMLSERFTGDGFSSYLDTGVNPYADPEASWTLLAQFNEDCPSGAGVYFSCFAEEAADYRGIMARRAERGVLNLLYGNRSINVEVPEGAEIRLAVIKDGVDYTIYVNDKLVVDHDLVEVKPWDGSLLLGCQEDENNERFRFSEATIYNFEFYHGVMEREAVLTWQPEYCPAPAPKIPSPVDYTMPQPFMGNGKDEYIDTLVQLYDVADKNWTLEMTFRKNGAQQLITCFAEDPNCYRGLIVSQLDDKTLSVTLGQGNLEFEIPPEPEHTLKIRKDGYDYTVWLDGAKAGELTSRAPEYDGTLHIGCAVDGSGKLFRFSEAKILTLSVSEND